MTSPFFEHRYTSGDGLSLYCRDYGFDANLRRDVVLCLHGLTRNSKDFHGLAARLSGRFRVLCPDVRGRGQSDRDRCRAHYNPGTYVRDTWALLDFLEVRAVAVIGTSLGGLMGMIMADQQPERIRGLVLNDIGPEVPPSAIARILAYTGRTPPARDWNEAAEQTRKAYEIALPGMPAAFWHDYARQGWRENSAGRPEPDVDPAIGDVLRRPPRTARLVQWLHRHRLVRRVAGVAIDPWDAYRSVTAPYLLIHGERSDVLTADIIRRMRSVKPELEVIDVPGRGHTPLLDEAVAVTAIETFLATVFGGRPQSASSSSSGAT